MAEQPEAAREEGSVGRAMDALTAAVERLEHHAGLLADNLAPVLRNEDDPSARDAASLPGDSELARSVYRAAERVESVVERLSNLRALVDL